MTRRPLDPRKVNVIIDANALDPNGGHDADVKRLLALKATGKISLIAPGSVRQEAQHPRTPATVRQNVSVQIFSLPVELNAEEQRKLATVRTILRGNAASGLHDADTRHVFEAAKYGGGYFITHDRRVTGATGLELDGLCVITAGGMEAVTDRFPKPFENSRKLRRRFLDVTHGGGRTMSPLTLFLGRFLGLSCLLMCTVLVARPKASLEAINSMMESPGLILVTGIFVTAGGAAMVVGHNVWSGGALPVAVTLLGWLTLLKGIALMAAPPHVLTAFYQALYYRRGSAPTWPRPLRSALGWQ